MGKTGKRWIKPAVGWAVRVDTGNRLHVASGFFSAYWETADKECGLLGRLDFIGFPNCKPIRAAVVPLAVARKAGLLKPPKD